MPAAAPQKKNEQSFKLPAPSKGMNTVLSLASMPPEYAVSATNFIASQQGLTIREGYEQYSTGFSSPVTSLIPYFGRTAASAKLFAVSGGNFYDVTSGGAIGSAVVSGMSTSSVYWQYASQVNSVTTYTICVNGTNAPQLYSGSSWTSCTQPSSPSAPGQFSQNDQNSNPVSIGSFIDVCLHAERWWFVPTGTTIAYYTDIGEVGGQLYSFDFGTMFPRGGFLQKLASWTIELGYGTVYNLVAISSRGDIVIFQGDDPSQSATFTQIGQYQLGTPIGQRCTFPLVGDIAYLSTDGLFPLSKYVQSPRVDVTSSLTYAIDPTIRSQIQAWGSTVGWEMIIHPLQKVMLLNVPQGSQAQNTQYCYSQTTMGWTQFTGWPAQCFAMFNDQLYFGGTNFVALAFTGWLDNVASNGTGGTNVTATGLQAFTDFELQGMKKVTAVKPYIISGQTNPSISVGVNTDFNPLFTLSAGTVLPPTGSMIWGSMIWGSMTWAGSQVTPNQWYAPNSWPGEYVAVGVSMTATSETTWIATNFMVQLMNSLA